MKRRIKAGREDTFPNEWERESHLGVQGVTVEISMGVGTQRFWGRGGAVAPFSQSSGGGGLPVSFVKQTEHASLYFLFQCIWSSQQELAVDEWGIRKTDILRS